MSESPVPDARRYFSDGSPAVEALHVLTLCAFAVAQPLFDLLGRNASFFVAHGASRADVLLFSAATIFVPWLLLLAARYLLSLVSKPAAHVFHLLTLALLGALALTTPIIRAWSLHWIPALAIAIASGVLIFDRLRRSRSWRRLLSALGIAVVAFPLLFLFASPVRDLLFTRGATAADLTGTRVQHSDTPVMVVLFDELSLASLITPNGRIDRVRYPNFARLVAKSTWYREATTAGLRTDQAVPAALTGRRVPRRQVPSSFAYPDNLFTLLAPTHRMHVHESVTQLCPPSVCAPDAHDATRGLGTLFSDAAVVYGHIVLPDDLAGRFLPPLGDRWAGFTNDAVAGARTSGGKDPVKSWLRAALLEAKQHHEGEVFSTFLDGVRATGSRPQFSWVHLQVPHPPWRYLPDGRAYDAGNSTPGYHDFKWGPNRYLVDEVLQRALLQTKFADKMAGRLIDHLKRTGQWDDMMLVVIADHGATWEPNQTRRDVVGNQRASLLGVPLFIKYPHQKSGRIDKMNAELIDVLPTIADVAGVDVGWRTHGSSLRKATRRPTKRVFDGARDRLVHNTFADVRRRAAELRALFGPGGSPDDLYGFGPDRGLLGAKIGDLVVGKASGARLDVTDAALYDDVAVDAPVLPALFRGRLSGLTGTGAEGTKRVAVAVNGSIAGVGETFTEEGGTQLSIVLSPRFFRDGRNDVRVFFIEQDTLVPLRS